MANSESMPRLPRDMATERPLPQAPPPRITVSAGDLEDRLADLKSALEKKPLVVIADAIVDLRYSDMMEMAELLVKLDGASTDKADSFKSAEGYAKLLHAWALRVRNPEQEPQS